MYVNRALVVDIWLKPEGLLRIVCEHGQVGSHQEEDPEMRLVAQGPRRQRGDAHWYRLVKSWTLLEYDVISGCRVRLTNEPDENLFTFMEIASLYQNGQCRSATNPLCKPLAFTKYHSLDSEIIGDTWSNCKHVAACRPSSAFFQDNVASCVSILINQQDGWLQTVAPQASQGRLRRAQLAQMVSMSATRMSSPDRDQVQYLPAQLAHRGA